MLVEAAAFSETEPEMPFRIWGKEVVLIAAGYSELIFPVFSQGYPAPAKQNACYCRQDDKMMRMVGRRDTRTIEKVAVGEDAAEIRTTRNGEGRHRCWDDIDMMVVGGPGGGADSRAAEEMRFLMRTEVAAEDIKTWTRVIEDENDDENGVMVTTAVKNAGENRVDNYSGRRNTR